MEDIPVVTETMGDQNLDVVGNMEVSGDDSGGDNHNGDVNPAGDENTVAEVKADMSALKDQNITVVLTVSIPTETKVEGIPAVTEIMEDLKLDVVRIMEVDLEANQDGHKNTAAEVKAIMNARKAQKVVNEALDKNTVAEVKVEMNAQEVQRVAAWVVSSPAE